MTKTVEITKQEMKKEKGGGILVNFSYTVTNELGEKKTGSGSFAVSQSEAIPSQIKATLKYKLGYSGFTINPERVVTPNPERKTISVSR